MLVFAVVFALLGALLAGAAWLIFGGNPKWSRADVLATIAIAVAIGGAVGAVFGPPLFERWLEKKSSNADAATGNEGRVSVSDSGVTAVGGKVIQSAGGDVAGRDQIKIGQQNVTGVDTSARGSRSGSAVQRGRNVAGRDPKIGGSSPGSGDE